MTTNTGEEFYLDETKPITDAVELKEATLTIRRSKKVDSLITALIAAQLEYDTVSKDAENEFYSKGTRKSKYATLDSAVTATRPHLNKHGLTIIQHLTSDNRNKELTVTTSLYHISEQFFESDLALPSVGPSNKFDPQTLASASTYGRRITWLAIAGAAPADDDDGNKSAGIGSREEAQALVPGKIAELKKKIGESVPSLFYIWFNESQTAQITGDRGLLKVNEDLLKPLKLDGKLIANGDQLEVLKVRLEERGVSFAPLKTL